MSDSPYDDIDEFMDEIRNWALGTQSFARKIHALSQTQQSLAAELRIEADEILQMIRRRRHAEHDVQKLFAALRINGLTGSSVQDLEGK